jgi:hypothetical protein
MPKKAKTTEEFQNELNEKYPDKYTIVGEYKNAKTKVQVCYNMCGHENFVRPSNLLEGTNCPICHNLHRVKHEDFIQRLEELRPGKYEILGEYIGRKTPIKVKIKECGHYTTLTPNQMFERENCPICNPTMGVSLSQEEFLNRIGTDYVALDPYINMKQSKIRVKHQKCGTVFTRSAATLLNVSGCKCPACFGSNNGGVLDIGVNDIHTLRPDLGKYLLNPDDAYKYSPYSDKKIEWKCPDCEYVFKRKIGSVSLHGFSCKLCGNKTSYGERFIMALLDTLNVEYIPQFMPQWVDHSRYDFYFKLNEINYIIEVDGGFHFINNNMSGESVEDVLQKDIRKEQEAIKRNFEIIRIDYYYKKDRYAYIVNSIMNSKLSELFDLSTIDFVEIDKKASGSLLIKISDAWNSYIEKSSKKIMSDFNISSDIARSILYHASDIGLIPESRKEIISLNRQYGHKYSNHLPQKVKCNETGEIFDSYKAAFRKYKAELSNYFISGLKTSGYLPDGTRLTWTKIVA